MPPPPSGTPPSVESFARAAVRAGLVPADRADAAAAGAATPTVLAERLTSDGSLTRFQADKLLRGIRHGLTVGPYQLLCPLGRGGMGIVYLARDPRPDATRRLVALKLLPPQRARSEPRVLARFLREMDLGTAMPPHPNLARTTDAGVSAGVHFLAMEYVPGRTVRQEIADVGCLNPGAACRVLADAAAGLAAAHAAGFVHRDVKPANVVLTPTGRGKVLDFGFALRVGEPTPADPTILGGQGYTVGTMDYLPPEQAADASKVGPPADVYALGCSLYYALTGSPPFPGGGAQEKIRWHRTAFPPPMTDLNPLVPAELDRVVRWLMAKNPAERPTAERVAQELAGWADPVRLVPPGSEPSDEALVRDIDQKWVAVRGSVPPADSAAVDVPGSEVPVLEPEDDVELLEDPPVAARAEHPPGVRVRAPRWALAAAAGAAVWTFFVLGVLVGYWAGRR